MVAKEGPRALAQGLARGHLTGGRLWQNLPHPGTDPRRHHLPSGPQPQASRRPLPDLHRPGTRPRSSCWRLQPAYRQLHERRPHYPRRSVSWHPIRSPMEPSPSRRRHEVASVRRRVCCAQRTRCVGGDKGGLVPSGTSGSFLGRPGVAFDAISGLQSQPLLIPTYQEPTPLATEDLLAPTPTGEF